MPPALQLWLGQHYYLAFLLAFAIEGLGLPLPAEALFLATATLIHRGQAQLHDVILVATGGNLLGTMTGFGLAYFGGPKLLLRITRLLGIKAEATRKVQDFFGRYGPLTVFLSRFVGIIRAGTIYSAGAARMNPWRFGIYILAAGLIWNTAWAVLAYRFGREFYRITHLSLGPVGWTVVVVLGALILGELLLRWYRRHSSAD